MKTALILFTVCAVGAIVTAYGGLGAGLTYYALISIAVGVTRRARS